jgi:hypothetical protein
MGSTRQEKAALLPSLRFPLLVIPNVKWQIMKKLSTKSLTAIKLFFKTLDLLDFVAIAFLLVLIIFAVPFGLVRNWIDSGQTLMATLSFVLMLLSAIAILMYFIKRRRVYLVVGLGSFCIVSSAFLYRWL